MRSSKAGSTSLQHLTVLVVVALAGVTGFQTLGGAFGRDVSGEVQGARTSSAAPAVSAQAGFASMAGWFSRQATHAREFAGFDRDFLRALLNGLPSVQDLGTIDKIEFDIPWNRIGAGNADEIANSAMERAAAHLDSVAEVKGRRTYENTIAPIDRADEELSYAQNILSIVEGLTDSDEMTEALGRIAPRFEEFHAKSYERNDLWRALRDFADDVDPAELDEQHLAYAADVFDTYREYRALPPAQAHRLLTINNEMTELQMKFAQNLEKAQEEFEVIVDAGKVAGLPDQLVQMAHKSAVNAGKEGFRFTLAEGTASAALGMSPNPELRETLWRALSSIGSSGETNNGPIIERILSLRRELAQLDGKSDYAEAVTMDRMVGGAENAERFVTDLADRTRPFADRDFEELRKMRQSVDGNSEINAWDYDYVSRHRYQMLFGAADASPYLPVNNVLAGAFGIAERLYGVKFTQVNLPVWHPDVASFHVTAEDGRWLGTIQMDLFAREGKSGGAWMAEMLLGEGNDPSVAVINANLRPAPPGQAPLLSMRDAQTVFHEFGHAMHLLFSEADVRALGGNRVAWDFVELPSQIMENWVWEPEALDMFARHVSTGEPMPKELFELLQKTQNYDVAREQMMQLALSAVDLALHRHYDPAVDGEVFAYARKVMQPYFPYELPDDFAQIATFGHIFTGGYAAGYYGYKWSEVLDADAFTRFHGENLFNREVGDMFRQLILSKGGTKKAIDLFRDFMKRDPDPEALMRRLGLVDEAGPTSQVLDAVERWRHAA